MKILVTAAGKHGSTEEIATIIAEGLRQRGLDAALEHPDEVASLDPYVGVVIGSAVYAGRWMTSAEQFVDRWTDALQQRQVWLFSSGPAGDPPKPEPGKAVDVSAMVAATHARDHQLFAGKIDKESLGLVERTLVRALHVAEGDYRDWSQIDDWAGQIADVLMTRRSPAAQRPTSEQPPDTWLHANRM